MTTGLIRLMVAAGAAAAVTTACGCIIVVDGKGSSHDYSWHDEPRAKHTWSEPISQEKVAATRTLRVVNQSGDVIIKPIEGEARFAAEARSPDADRANSVTIEFEVEGDELCVKPVWRDRVWHDNESVDLTLYLPVREGVDIETDAGDVEVAGMTGPLRIDSSAGDVEVHTHHGPVRASSSAGDIYMEHVSGSIDAETSAGDIDLHDVAWPIEAETSAGDITVAMQPGFLGTLDASTSAGDIEFPDGYTIEQRSMGPMAHASVTFGDAKDRCEFRTSAGDVVVHIDDD